MNITNVRIVVIIIFSVYGSAQTTNDTFVLEAESIETEDEETFLTFKEIYMQIDFNNMDEYNNLELYIQVDGNSYYVIKYEEAVR